MQFKKLSSHVTLGQNLRIIKPYFSILVVRIAPCPDSTRWMNWVKIWELQPKSTSQSSSLS